MIAVGFANRKLRGAVRRVSRSTSPVVRHGYRAARRVARGTVNALTDRQVGWVGMLWAARWRTGDGYEIIGWAYERGFGYPDGPPVIEVWLACGRHRIDAQVESLVEPEVNARARNAEFDYANTAFRARFDLAGVRARVDEADLDPAGWQVWVRVSGPRRVRLGTLNQRYGPGSARHLSASTVDGVQVVPRWEPGAGLLFTAQRPAVFAGEVAVTGRELSVVVRSGGPVLTRAVLETGSSRRPLACRPLGDGPAYAITGELGDDYPEPEAEVSAGPRAAVSAERRLLVGDGTGAWHRVHTDLDEQITDVGPGVTTVGVSGSEGELVLLDAPQQVMVEGVAFERSPVIGLRLRGRILGEDRSGLTFAFAGARQELPVEAEVGPDGRFQAFGPLLASVWDQEPLPPRVGGYAFQVRAADGSRLPVWCTPELATALPEAHPGPGFRFRLQCGVNRRFQFRVSPPRRPDEMGGFHQRRLTQEYRTRAWCPRNAVYFESFYGRNSTCNPRALDGEFARLFPQLTRLWGVVDASVPVPPGAIAVVQGTREWWEARATARYVVANDWLRRWFTPQPFQIVLQTWHGSMFKRIGLDRPGLPRPKQRALRRERDKWDVLLSQNHHSTETFATAYDWHRTVFEEGYPRNDRLSTETGEAIRERLGVRSGKTAVLYAPTWRDNLTSMVTFLDLTELTRALGEDYVILLRGHSRTVEFGESVEVPGVIDVTTYPEIAELYLAADALVTDYSSVMFDYSVTRRPMIFFTPDMDDYRDSLRGVYFDLSEIAPGPVLARQEEVVEAIRSLDTHPERYRDRYAAWIARFNHHDDGHAGERVVRRLMALRKDAATGRLEEPVSLGSGRLEEPVSPGSGRLEEPVSPGSGRLEEPVSPGRGRPDGDRNPTRAHLRAT